MVLDEYCQIDCEVLPTYLPTERCPLRSILITNAYLFFRLCQFNWVGNIYLICVEKTFLSLIIGIFSECFLLRVFIFLKNKRVCDVPHLTNVCIWLNVFSNY